MNNYTFIEYKNKLIVEIFLALLMGLKNSIVFIWGVISSLSMSEVIDYIFWYKKIVTYWRMSYSHVIQTLLPTYLYVIKNYNYVYKI